MEEVTSHCHKKIHAEDGVPVVSICTSNQEKRTFRKAVAFSK